MGMVRKLYIWLINFLAIAMLCAGLQAQTWQPAMLVCKADEPDIHNRITADIKCAANKTNSENAETIKRLTEISDDLFPDKYSKLTLYRMEIQKQLLEIRLLQERYNRDKKIAGIVALLLFASGNDALKNVGLVSLFCYSIW